MALITFFIARYFPISELYVSKPTTTIESVLNVQHVPSQSSIVHSSSSNITVCPKCPIACPATDDIKELNMRLNSLEKIIIEIKNQKPPQPPPSPAPVPKEDPKINQLFQEIDLIRRDHLTNMQQLNDKITKISQEIYNYKTELKPEQLIDTNTPSMEEIEDRIRQALQIYDADKTGMADFALESSGNCSSFDGNYYYYYHKKLLTQHLF